MKRLWQKVHSLLRGRDKGTVAVTFMLVLPFLMGLVGMLVQYALLLNARLTVDRAAQAAARSAMTSLPTDILINDKGGPGYPNRSALMILESLSPASRNGTSSEAIAVMDALASLGANPPSSYAARYTYAQEGTQITIEPIDAGGTVITAFTYAQAPAPRARITVAYNYQLTVPLIKDIIGHSETIGGINGRFITITSIMDVQLSPGREAPTNGIGNP